MTVDNRYRIVSRLAQGGMGELHLARETLAEGIERDVVVKRLTAESAEDEEQRAMLLDEARILSRLSHPGVVQLLAVGSGREPYLVLEWVDGASLQEVLQRGARMSVETALCLGLSIAETLAYVHDVRDELGRPLQIVHRDLTPANVLIGRHGAVKLIDFGIARGENRVYATSTGVLKGTCGYMAPEQLLATADVDRRVDVFALGVLLYELCCGRHPFVSKQPQELLDMIAEGRYLPPERAEPRIGPGVASLITSCLATAREGRPPTMRVVAASLREELRHLGHVPTHADLAPLGAALVSPASPGRPSRRPQPASEPDDRRVTQVAHKPK